MKFGTSYYPELIDENEWSTDLTRMRNAGLGVIRMLDFAWTAIEPAEGAYTWDWLDRFLELAHSNKFEVILCTPTATAPAWLVRQYPQIMVVLAESGRREFGGRRDVSVCSAIYRDYAVRLAADLGKRYGNHPAVIGWQIDNELMGPEFAPMEDHNPEAQWRFRRWLRERYSDAGEINAAWGMRFWNQEFSDWGEITTPFNRRCCPGWRLDYARFLTDMNAEFIALQRNALRSVISPEQFITHNSTAILDRGIDHRLYARQQDVTGWDAYHGAAFSKLPEVSTALAHDLFRCFLGKPFWVYETNPGTLPFTSASMAEMHARGAAGVLFWHWRQHRANVEQGCAAVCDFAGRPIPERLEAIENAAKAEELSHEWTVKFPHSRAALVFAPDCVRAGPVDPYLLAVVNLYAALRQLGVRTDVIHPDDSLDDYDLLLLPSLKLLSREQASSISAFVLHGGTLVGTGPLAQMDLHGVFYAVPGEPLESVMGFTFRGPFRDTGEPEIALSDNNLFTPESNVEILDIGPAQVLGRFTTGRYEGEAAVTSHRFGKGHTFYSTCTSRRLDLELARCALKSAKIDFHDQPYHDLGLFPDFANRGLWCFNYGAEPRTFLETRIPSGDFKLIKNKQFLQK